MTLVDAGEIPLSHGDFTTIQRHRSNKTEVVRPKHFFDIAHMDITYGDTVAPGGIKFALIIVDHKTRYNFVLLLSNAVSDWYHQNDSIILAAPPEQQHQNGLVERTWKTISQMARAYINDKQMPKSFGTGPLNTPRGYKIYSRSNMIKHTLHHMNWFFMKSRITVS